MNTELRRSKRRVKVCETSKSEPFLFITEPKQKCSDVKVYHIYRITETLGLESQLPSFINIAAVCTDITAVKRIAIDGAM